MRIKRVLSLLAIITFLGFISGCSSEGDQDQEVNDKVQVDKANVLALDLEVDGMVCPQGCARTIEQKVGDMKGIVSCKVDFESKKASIEYDKTVLDDKKIISKITTMHDGQYKVTSHKTPSKEVDVKGDEKEENQKTAYNSSSSNSGNKFIFTEIITYFMNGF